MAKRKSLTEREWSRKAAAREFNLVWKLLRKPGRTPAEVDRMIHAAHASRYHWGLVGTATNFAVGEWQISRVYAVLRRSEPALYHAHRCLQICRRNRIGDFALAYAYEALARSHGIAGHRRERDRNLALAWKAGEKIREAEDRDLLVSDLRTIPGGRRLGPRRGAAIA